MIASLSLAQTTCLTNVFVIALLQLVVGPRLQSTTIESERVGRGLQNATIESERVGRGLQSATIESEEVFRGLSAATIEYTGCLDGIVIDVNPVTLDFGSVPVDSNDTATVTVTSAGCESLTLSALTLSGSAAYSLVSPPTLPLVLGQGQSVTLTVRFAPTQVGQADGELDIECDDPNNETVTVSLTGSTPSDKSVWTSTESSYWLQNSSGCDGTAANLHDGRYTWDPNASYLVCDGRVGLRGFTSPFHQASHIGEWFEIDFHATMTISRIQLLQTPEGMIYTSFTTPPSEGAHINQATLTFSDSSSVTVYFADQDSVEACFPAKSTTTLRVTYDSFHDQGCNGCPPLVGIIELDVDSDSCD